ncbi:hypothetical protein BOX15_Mlig000448g3, partial [Macrostomum lignano]
GSQVHITAVYSEDKPSLQSPKAANLARHCGHCKFVDNFPQKTGRRTSANPTESTQVPAAMKQPQHQVGEDPMLSDALDLTVQQQNRPHSQPVRHTDHRPERAASDRPDVVERRCAEARGIVSVKWDVTRKNKESIVIDGYKMTESRSGKDGRVFWRCSKRFCPATAISIGRRLLSVRRVTACRFHSHPPAGQDEYFSADYQASGTPTEVAVKWPLTPRQLDDGGGGGDSPLKRPRHSSVADEAEDEELQQQTDEAADEDVIVDSDGDDEEAAPTSGSLLNVASVDPLDSPTAAFPIPMPPPPPRLPQQHQPCHPSVQQLAGLNMSSGGGSVAALNSPEFLAMLSAAIASGVAPPHQLQQQPPPLRAYAADLSAMPPPPPPPPLPQQPQNLMTNRLAASCPAGVDNAQLLRHLRRLEAYFRAGINGISNLIVCSGGGGGSGVEGAVNDEEFLKQLFNYMDGLSRVQRLAAQLT